eukprot:CAMPEP_0203743712 /NCGR_PEP_ID=MMETSP0098-20131031/29_1 /ASSEMBLY_ACC=CAM_ASM_000208 /TAXON_ID=96639 /ORGANISM=" , Strain NY0313808BC1" /LENGTH=1164 /DNA_ID=CAMNT_0050631033 /DNA_START=223 /DNA_END=3717 /DNA_ORIENTATION=-
MGFFRKLKEKITHKHEETHGEEPKDAEIQEDTGEQGVQASAPKLEKPASSASSGLLSANTEQLEEPPAVSPPPPPVDAPPPPPPSKAPSASPIEEDPKFDIDEELVRNKLVEFYTKYDATKLETMDSIMLYVKKKGLVRLDHGLLTKYDCCTGLGNIPGAKTMDEDGDEPPALINVENEGYINSNDKTEQEETVSDEEAAVDTSIPIVMPGKPTPQWTDEPPVPPAEKKPKTGSLYKNLESALRARRLESIHGQLLEMGIIEFEDLAQLDPVACREPVWGQLDYMGKKKFKNLIKDAKECVGGDDDSAEPSVAESMGSIGLNVHADETADAAANRGPNTPNQMQVAAIAVQAMQRMQKMGMQSQRNIEGGTQATKPPPPPPKVAASEQDSGEVNESTPPPVPTQAAAVPPVPPQPSPPPVPKQANTVPPEPTQPSPPPVPTAASSAPPVPTQPSPPPVPKAASTPPPVPTQPPPPPVPAAASIAPPVPTQPPPVPTAASIAPPVPTQPPPPPPAGGSVAAGFAAAAAAVVAGTTAAVVATSERDKNSADVDTPRKDSLESTGSVGSVGHATSRKDSLESTGSGIASLEAEEGDGPWTVQAPPPPSRLTKPRSSEESVPSLKDDVVPEEANTDTEGGRVHSLVPPRPTSMRGGAPPLPKRDSGREQSHQFAAAAAAVVAATHKDEAEQMEEHPVKRAPPPLPSRNSLRTTTPPTDSTNSGGAIATPISNEANVESSSADSHTDVTNLAVAATPPPLPGKSSEREIESTPALAVEEEDQVISSEDESLHNANESDVANGKLSTGTAVTETENNDSLAAQDTATELDIDDVSSGSGHAEGEQDVDEEEHVSPEELVRRSEEEAKEQERLARLARLERLEALARAEREALAGGGSPTEGIDTALEEEEEHHAKPPLLSPASMRLPGMGGALPGMGAGNDEMKQRLQARNKAAAEEHEHDASASESKGSAPCGNFRLDLAATAFNTCKCGFPKTEHSASSSPPPPRSKRASFRLPPRPGAAPPPIPQAPRPTHHEDVVPTPPPVPQVAPPVKEADVSTPPPIPQVGAPIEEADVPTPPPIPQVPPPVEETVPTVEAETGGVEPSADVTAAAVVNLDVLNEDVPIRDQVKAFYSKYNPEKIGDLERILARFEGREEVLLEKLKKKYVDGN